MGRLVNANDSTDYINKFMTKKAYLNLINEIYVKNNFTIYNCYTSFFIENILIS